MTDARFEELINLYLDNEIGRHELGELKDAMRGNVLRRQRFERACQLHQAALKALVAHKEQPAGEADAEIAEEQAGDDSADDAIRDSGHSPRSHREARSGRGGSSTARERQEHARRNASVPTLAERQLSKGAASTVKVDKIDLGSRRSSRAEGGDKGQAFSFFDSTANLMMVAFFALIALGGIYVFYEAAIPSSEDLGQAPNGQSAIRSQNGPIDPEELQRELHKGTANAAEAMHANIYQSVGGLSAGTNSDTGTVNTTASPTPAAASDATATATIPAASAPSVAPVPDNANVPGSEKFPPPSALAVPDNGSATPANAPVLQLNMPGMTDTNSPSLNLLKAPPPANGTSNP